MSRIYDITQDLNDCRLFPGDPKPEITRIESIADGDMCNLTHISMRAHCGTHVDAPLHFIDGGRTIGEMGLEPFVGRCYVAQAEGDLTREEAAMILKRAQENDASERILIAGPVTLTPEAGEVFVQGRIMLYGNESQTVGPETGPAAMHHLMLGAGIVLLEGIDLEGVPEGAYFLNAAPIGLMQQEGAPCRAWLMKED